MIYRAINGLIRHAIEADLITNDDIFVVRNQLMDILKLTDWNDKEPLTGNIEELLEPLIDYAVKAGIIEDTSVQRDLFDTRSVYCIHCTLEDSFLVLVLREQHKEKSAVNLVIVNYHFGGEIYIVLKHSLTQTACIFKPVAVCRHHMLDYIRRGNSHIFIRKLKT